MNQRKGCSDSINFIAGALMPWFARNARDLPWRREPCCKDPYGVHVSEIMLQQTQVKTVIPYWTRWMTALPTIEALARAKPKTLLKLWEGLGYYHRAWNLQKAAQQILDRHDGRFPTAYEEVLALPGVGRYTAGAICSIAFNQPTPILDGNVTRVLTRLFGIRGDPKATRTNQRLWQLADALVNSAATLTLELPREPGFSGNCSMFNQAVMELGATLCTPRQPKCAVCPVQNACYAFRAGKADRFPQAGSRATATPRRFLAFVIECQGRILVRQRPAGVVNAHFWELPNVEVEPIQNTEMKRKPKGRLRSGSAPLRQDLQGGPRDEPPRSAGFIPQEGANSLDGKQNRSRSKSGTSGGLKSALRAIGLAHAIPVIQPADSSTSIGPTAIQPLGVLQHTITRYRIRLETYHVSLREQPPAAKRAERWVTREELTALPLVSAHRKALRQWH